MTRLVRFVGAAVLVVTAVLMLPAPGARAQTQCEFLGTTRICKGAGSPNSALTGSIGDLYLQTNGSADAVLWIKEAGSSTNTGWESHGSVAVPVTAAQGGTGQTVYTIGDILSANTTTTLSKVAAVAAGSYFRSAGTGTLPLWSTLILPNAGTANQLCWVSSTNTVTCSTGTHSFDGSTLLIGTTTANGAGAGDIRANDAFYERGRGTALGDWTLVAFSAGNFTASGSMTWTVADGDEAVRYSRVGKAMYLSFEVVTTTVGGTLAKELRMTLPDGCTAGHTTYNLIGISDNGTFRAGGALVAIGGTYVSFYTDLFFGSAGGANWSAATDNTQVTGQMFFECQ